MNNIFYKKKLNIILLITCIMFFGSIFTIRSIVNNYYKSGSRKIISNEILPLSGIVSSPQGVDIHVRIANTEKTRELGLSYLKGMPQDQGMLFVFPQLGIYPFWMKDMNFPLDIIWLDENSVIVDRIINADPSGYPKTFTPKERARYVLEISGNTADQYGFLVGSKIIIKK